jgi:hypothetical protein
MNIGENKKMKMPDEQQLKTMWSIAKTSAIEDGLRKPYEIFARLLYIHFLNSNSNSKVKV